MKERIWLYLGVCCLVGFTVGFTQTGGWDIWWHLLTGKVAWDGTIDLATDPFSSGFLGEPWLYKDLPADILLYLGFDTMQFAWFALLKSMVVLALAAALGFYARGKHVSLSIAALVLGLTVASIQYRIIERPIIFSLMIYPVFLFVLKRAFSLDTFRGRARWSAGLAGLIGVWCMLHRAALIGFPLVLLYGYSSWLAGRFRGNREASSGVGGVFEFLQPVGIVALGGVFSLANPEGTRLWTTSIGVAQSAELKAHISEWSSLSPAELFADFSLASVWIALGLACCLWDFVVTHGNGRRLHSESFADLVVMAALTTLVVTSVRYLPYAAIYAVFPILRMTHRYFGLLPALLVRSGRLAMYPAAVLIVAVANPFPSGLGAMPGRYPKGAIEFVRSAGIDGPVMNAFHFAGYSLWHLWPEVRVLVDGRNDMVYPPSYVVAALNSQRNEAVFEQLSSETSANWVLASSDVNQPTHLFLAQSPFWSLVYWSDEASVYVRRGRYPQLDEQRYRQIDPRSIDGSVHRVMQQGDAGQIEGLGRELQRMLRASQDSRRVLAASALFFHLLGPDYHSRRDELVAQLSRVPDGDKIAEQLQKRFDQNSN